CVFFDWPGDDHELFKACEASSLYMKPSAGGQRRRYVQQAMLVDIRQLFEHPKRLKLGVLPAVVGLKPLNACACGPRHASHFVEGASISSPFEARTRLEDRKSGGLREVIRERTGVDTSERKGKVIESGPVLVDALADEDAQVRRRLLDVLKSGVDQLFRPRIGDRVIEVSVNEPFDRAVEVVGVLLCPVELQKDAI